MKNNYNEDICELVEEILIWVPALFTIEQSEELLKLKSREIKDRLREIEYTITESARVMENQAKHLVELIGYEMEDN